MSSDEFAIRARDVSKHYVMFARPEDRLKQMIVPRLQRVLGRPPRRYFKDFAALNGVSFDIRRGETVGIIGRNGSGKSTLLQIVCGTLQPTSGSVQVNGRIAALLELGAGFNPEFTGRENVYLNAAILGLPRAEIDARFDSIARFADIGDFIEQPVKTYSSGMYVRLAFATAINVDPDILVVDEALSVGDEAFQRKCFARIEDIKDKGGTILFVSHGAQTIVQLCDRAMLIDGGELILEGRPKLVTTQYQRLVNASADTAATIKQSIREGVAHQSLGEGQQAAALAEMADAATSAAMAPSAWEHADYFDPNLVSQSTVHLEERGARIHDVRLLTREGQQVNIMRGGRKYIFEYLVDFDTYAENLGFGIWFRTVEGIGLGGAQTILSPTYRTPSIKAGQSARIRWEFSCILLPGAYFLSCGVSGTVNAERIVMNRITDALMVKVATEEESIALGRVDFAAQAYIDINSGCLLRYEKLRI